MHVLEITRLIKFREIAILAIALIYHATEINFSGISSNIYTDQAWFPRRLGKQKSSHIDVR